MTKLEQKYYTNGVLDCTVTHIFSTSGHFEKDGINSGFYIQLGSDDSDCNYVEIDDGLSREVPEIYDVYSIVTPRDIDPEDIVEILEGVL